jgi:DNA-binding HxlR family transcriptional regulator
MKKTRLQWEQTKKFCETLTDEQDQLTREMVSRLADKWSLWTLGVLAEAGSPLRFSRIMEHVEGVSQKSLTKTLRGLERDGLVTRKVFAEVPPRVEYAMTALGTELLEQVGPLWLWVATSLTRFEKTRAVFDGH